AQLTQQREEVAEKLRWANRQLTKWNAEMKELEQQREKKWGKTQTLDASPEMRLRPKIDDIKTHIASLEAQQERLAREDKAARQTLEKLAARELQIPARLVLAPGSNVENFDPTRVKQGLIDQKAANGDKFFQQGEGGKVTELPPGEAGRLTV